MNDEILDKKIVYINSSNSTFLNNLYYDFYFNMMDPILNVVYIKVMKCEVILDPRHRLNSNDIKNIDPIFIDVNGYDRFVTSLDTVIDRYSSNMIDRQKNIKYFEQININKIEKYGTGNVHEAVAFNTEYSGTGCNINDTNMFVLDPIEPKLRRFNIRLYDKNYNMIDRNNLSLFTMTLCIYSKRKKVTMT
jgi:hypothetical protein